jgi:hypothetical protein
VSSNDLDETDLIRELEHLHRTRHDTFLHGAPDALREYGSRTAELNGSTCAVIPSGTSTRPGPAPVPAVNRTASDTEPSPPADHAAG